MKIDIKSESDDNFKMHVKKCEEISNISSTEEISQTVKNIEDEIEPIIKNNAAPIENSKGLGWFDGTMWGTK